MSRFVRFCAFLSVLFFTSHAFAAGYSCPTYKKYTSCNSGYYLSDCGTTYSGQTISSPAAGNSCESCPSGYTCSGGAVCPKASTISVTCSAGKYIASGATTCSSTCGSGYYCPGGTFTISASGASAITGRSSCPSGYGSSAAGSDASSDCYLTTTAGKYIATANSSTQTTCTANYYCPATTIYYGKTGGRNACTGLGSFYTTSAEGSDAAADCYGTTTAGKYIATANSSTQTTCTANYYCPSANVYYGSTGTRTSCPSGYGTSAAGSDAASDCYLTTTAGKYIATANSSSQTTCTANYYCPATTIYYGKTGGRTSCPTAYPNSATGATSSAYCYLTTTAGKYVATAAAGEVTCTAGGYCAGGSTIYYGSAGGSTTGGRTACGAGKYNASTGSSASSACASITAGCYGTSATSSCPAVCADNKYSNAGASSCTSCPTDYENTGTTAASHAGSASCKITVDGGYYIGTAGDNSSNWDKCAGGTYKASHTVAYGSTSSCSACGAGKYSAAGATSCSNISAGCYGTSASTACPASCAAGTYSAAGSSSCTACSGRTKYSAAGASSCSTVSSGYYTTGCNTSNNNCTGQSQCTGATYCASGVQYSCPSGYDDNTTAGKTAATSCQMSVSAKNYVKTANDSSATACGTGTYKAAHTVNYGSTSSCSSCPSGYDDGAAVATQAECIISVAGGKYIGTANSATTSTCSAGYYKAAHSVAYGSTSSCTACGAVNKYSSSGASSCSTVSTGYYTTGGTTTTRTGQSQCTSGTYCSGGVQNTCPSGYGASAAGSDAASDCYMSVSAKYHVAAANDSSATACGTGTYKAAHTVYYGGTSTCSSCPSGYDDGAAASAQSGCTISVACGKYIGTANSATASSCASGYYKAAHSVAYGSTSSCTQATGANYTADACTLSACPSGYTANTTAGKTAATQCTISVAGGKYVGTKNSATLSTCAGGTYKGAHTVAYGSTSSCAACTAGNYCPSGSASQTACSSLGGGLYVNSAASSDASTDCYVKTTAGKYIKATTDTAQTTCPSGDYCPATTLYWDNAGGNIDCPGSYTAGGTGVTAQSGCKISVADGKYVGTANSSTLSSCTAGTYKAAHTVAYGSTSTCASCTGATYSGSGAASCSSCPTGYTADTTSGKTAATQCTISVAGGKYVGTANSSTLSSCAAGTYKAAHTVAYGSTSSCGQCPANSYCPAAAASATSCSTLADGFYPNSAAGSDAASDCKTNSISGAYVKAANDSSATTCAGGTYKGSHQVNYGSTSTCATCSANNYCPAGASTQTACSSLGGGLYTTSAAGSDAAADCKATVTAGYYLASATNTSLTSCTAGYYCPGTTLAYNATGGRTACSTLGTGYTSAGGTSMKANTNCYLPVSAGNVRSGTSGTTTTQCAGGTYKAAHNAYYGTSYSCSSCTAGNYCPAGSGAQTACSTLADGFYPNSAAGSDAASDCYTNSISGKYVAEANDSGATSCAAGYAKGAHTVNYGSTSSCSACTGATYAANTGQSSCTACPTATNDTANVTSYGYWNTSSEAGNHTVRAGCYAQFKSKTLEDGAMTNYRCYIDSGADTYGVDGTSKTCWVNRTELTCDGGYYNATFNNSSTATQYTGNKTLTNLYANACTNVGAGYWSADESLTRTACATGLTTIGYGTAANEAADCGRKLHAGDNVIYLRSEARTSPALNVKVGDTTFYGALSTSLSGALKVKKDSTEYSVVNDWE